MISGAPATGRMPSAGSNGCWSACGQVVLLGASTLVILAERAALLWCVVYYLQLGQVLWAGLTSGLLLPGYAVQVLSYRWYRADGEQRRCKLVLTHLLHLGILHRFWDCMVWVWGARGSSGALVAVAMRQADVSALRLLEALLLTLPQTLLQSYILLTLGNRIATPVALCCGVCVLSISWALVLYSRACVLLRPGHVPMTPAALLCQLLWRMGTLGVRLASLALFTRALGYWVCGVTGFHWLLAVLWLTSQQTDICVGQWGWRISNGILGAVHIFLFLNVKDGPSRYRMAAFYMVVLLEDAVLLLAASDVLTDPSWGTLIIPAAILSGALLGLTALVLYYRFLHPKSTEISQGLRSGGGHAGSVCLDQADSSFSLGEKNLPRPVPLPHHGSHSLSGIPDSLLDHSGKPAWECRHHHHHWLLIRLALKTGDPTKINRAFGAGGVATLLAGECDSALKGGDGGGVWGGGAGGTSVSGSDSKDGTLAPLSDCREEFQSVAEDGAGDDDGDEDESLAMVSPLESPASECKRSSPEGKSVFGDSPEPTFCPTESSSTLYFSADPQSPCSTSNSRQDRDTPFSFGSGSGSGSGAETLAELSPLSSDAGLHRGALGRAGPRYTSAPRLDGPGLPEPSTPHLTGPRRQLVLSRRGLDEDGPF